MKKRGGFTAASLSIHHIMLTIKCYVTLLVAVPLFKRGAILLSQMLAVSNCLVIYVCLFDIITSMDIRGLRCL